MTIANSSSARRAGFKINNESILDVAAIAMSKIGCRTLYVPLSTLAFHAAGAAVGSATDGIFRVITMGDAGASNLYTSFRLPAEWDSGTCVLSIYWKTTVVSGNALFTVDLASKAAGGTTALEETQTVITAAETTASKINKSQVTFLAADFTAGDLIGIKITRDGTAGTDTLASSLSFLGAVFEFTGRG